MIVTRTPIVLPLLGTLLLPPLSPELRRLEAVEPHMGTLVRITVYVPDEEAARRAFAAAFARIRELETILSDYRDDSELNRVTREAVGRAVPVSADLFTVLRAAQDLAQATGGAFDITQGAVARLWREARRTGRAPDPVALREAAGRSGFRKLRLDDWGRTVTVEVPGMALDVGGIAKGYAADEALAVLERQGITRALVAVSGDLALGAAPPGRAGWRVRLHDGDAAGIPEVVELADAAVSTSGSSAQHLEVEGRRYSHIIDPASGTGLVADLQVTVIARRGIDADGLSTAASVLGIDRGLALIETRPDAAAAIVQRAGHPLRAHVSPRFGEVVRSFAAPAALGGPQKDGNDGRDGRH